MSSKSLALTTAAVLWLAGCDSNPNGPSAPSPAPAEPGAAPAPGQPKTQPLKSAGQPIGFVMPLGPAARRL